MIRYQMSRKTKAFQDKKVSKKLLTNESGYDKISELPLRTTATNETLIFDK